MAFAYEVQRELFQGAGLTQVGWKIALTTRASQALCKTCEPIAGILSIEGMHEAPCRIDRSDYARLGLEMELAVRIGKSLPDAPGNLFGIGECIDRVCAAFEVIDDRLADYQQLDAGSLVADNCWNRGFILGDLAECVDVGTLDELACRLEVDGAGTVAGQITSEIHPFAMVAWLDQHLRARGAALNPGDWVMSGNLLPTQLPVARSHYRFLIGDSLSVDLEVA